MKGLIIPTILLSAFGVFNIFGIRESLFINQILFVVVSFIVFLLLRKIGRNFFFPNSGFFYWLFIVILLLTYVVGYEVKGSKRWIDLYFFNFQASEFFKAFFIIHLAKFLSERQANFDETKVFLGSIFYFAIPAVIIFLQPDLGNSLVYSFVYVVLILFSKLPKKYPLYLLTTMISLAPVGWFILKDYQRARFFSFFMPDVNTQGTAYNMIQSIITIGSGKFLGRGLGLGTQSRLFFLPENHTDFAFASSVEQFGFLGGLTILVLYFLIFIFLIKKLLRSNNENFLYILGIISYLFFQVVVNVGMNLGLMPITGIALPFISYGGSSIVALMAALAFVF